jgi:translation initiation factor 2 alpha subunit (eIF-2alpha)
VGDIVVADVQRIQENAVYCVLPAYKDYEVLLPVTEIGVRRHRKVTDYVTLGKRIVVQVITADESSRLDVSLKQVRENETATALDEFHRRKHLDTVLRTAAANDAAAARALYEAWVWPYGLDEVYARFEAVKTGEDDGTTWPPTLVRAICQHMAMPVKVAEREVVVRFGTAHDGVSRLNAALKALATHEGVSVFVLAPPRYRVVAKDKTAALATARLEAAVAGLPTAT